MTDFLAGILSGINSIIHNYGWSMVIFTVLIKTVLIPFDYKSRKSMRRMTSLQPQVAKIQKKYANDKDKLNQKTSELYQREKINPLSSCGPMLITMPILFIMFAAMRSIANTGLATQTFDLLLTGQQVNETWLWIKNLWMPDSPFNAMIPDAANIQMIPVDIWTKVFNSLDASQMAQLATMGIDSVTLAGKEAAQTIFAALQTIPSYAQETALWAPMPTINLIVTQLNIYANNNGLFILPLLAAGTQVLVTLTQPQAAPADPNSSQASTGKMMKYFMPIFTLWLCASYTSAFTIYWVTSNIFAGVQGVIMNKIFANMDAKQKASVGEDSLK
ncbi:MAG: YidC/Oxa1 family membrane protein insertase [Clostridiales bacterium]|nr:YidC/Oxa1 family membrane protein insertase [Clostridiales bacterium]